MSILLTPPQAINQIDHCRCDFGYTEEEVAFAPP